MVAINKIDKPGADVERAKQGLLELNLVPEEWGGNTPMVAVSAKKGVGARLLGVQMRHGLGSSCSQRLPRQQQHGSCQPVWETLVATVVCCALWHD